MKITDTRIKLLENSGKLKGVASLTFDDCFVVHDVKIVEGTDGFFIIMPGKKGADGSFKDIAHPINTETRNYIQETVLTAFKAARESS